MCFSLGRLSRATLDIEFMPLFLKVLIQHFISCRELICTSPGYSYYARTEELQPQFYQDLLDRGWRRSGTLLYKPDLRKSCCPSYTIRLDSHQFHPTKDQRQVVNRFNRYILGDQYTKEAARLYPKSREQAKKRNTDFDLQQRIHDAEKEELKSPPEPAHSFTVTLESSEFTEEKYQVYKNYQETVHHDPPHRISKHGFGRFLCDSPLRQSISTLHGRTKNLGSYHQCYRIDGELIAIGVLDLLPTCVSAVYFMYHESVHSHGFGKFGALREISLAQEEGYQYWYAGFYIHSCVKMRYKGDYSPQYILDPETYRWNLLDGEMRKRMDEKKFISEKDDQDQKQESPSSSSSSHTPVFQTSMPGLLSTNDLLSHTGTTLLNTVKLRIGDDIHETNELVRWKSDGIDDATTVKGAIVELVSVVGWRAAAEMVVYFG